ncbi:MAG: 4-hydroxy-tetrahydrodipicolinate reductase, partial [Verrucomicrobiota bacterium]|nr:4-hydroxy-tetrahydrodipicolinate reductase [Verrucomicrobiota bacterium]
MNIAILGAAGRMGQNLIACAQKIPGCDIAAAIEQPGHPLLGQPVPGAPPLRYAADWPDAADAVIDFTFHAATPPNLARAV